MSDIHSRSYDYFDLRCTVSDEGDVTVEFVQVADAGVRSLKMDWDTFRDVLDFVCVHGMDIEDPYVVAFKDTREATEGSA